MRRLPLLVSALVFVETMFFAAITPLLPELKADLHLSKHAAGVLAGAYAAGALCGALPGGWLAARVGFRRAVLVGIALMTVSGVAFAFGRSLELLDAARFVQGVGGAFTWAGGMAWLASTVAPERRGQTLGAALGAAIFGVQFGPLIGALATAIGKETAFSSTVAFGVLLGAWAWTFPAPAADAAPTTPTSALRDRAIRAGMWFGLLPGVAFGLLELLVPLRLDVLGASGLAIGAVFFVAAGFEAIIATRAGRLSDRRGAVRVALWALVLGIVVLVALPWPGEAWLLGVVVAVGAGLLGALWVPAMALITAGADGVGLDQGYAFGFFNLSWATGMTLGAVAGGAFAQATSDTLAYVLVAAAYVLTALVTVRVMVARDPTARRATVSQ